MREDDWLPIETAPKDGTLVRLKCEQHPEYGEHVMEWYPCRKVWKKEIPYITGTLVAFWDETLPQPTHYQPIVGPKLKREGE